jgi:cation transport ATPase
MTANESHKVRDPVCGMEVDPASAAAAMSLGFVSVVGNALRLRKLPF